MHPLLKRQLRRASRGREDGSVDYDALLQLVGAAYEEADVGRRQGELAIRRMSEEMTELNDVMQAQAQAQYRLLVEKSTSGIYIHTDGLIIYANASFAKMMGVSYPEDLIGRRALDCVHPDHHAAVLDRRYRGAGWPTHEIDMLRVDGTVFVGEIAATRIIWEGKDSVLLMARDLTQAKEAEDELRRGLEAAKRASRAKTEFLANMSHELRTPLNAIIGFSEMMRRQLLGPIGHEQYQEYAEDIYNSAEHLLEIINDILDLSKIEAGEFDLREDWIDPVEMVDASLRLVAARARTGNLKLLSHTVGRHGTIYVDSRIFRQILLNLFSNSIKFTEPGGKITVSSTLDANAGFAMAVTDTGIGMSSEDVEVALTPFAQVDSALNRRFEGTGLGLPLTKKLVELHGGTMVLTSQRGHGTTVTVRLPVSRIAIGRDRAGAQAARRALF